MTAPPSRHYPVTDATDTMFRTWMCVVCGFIYDEADGLPEEGIAPGTRWEDIPADWTCPDCGVGKDDFEMVELED
ncbi:rubredoxin [Pseudoxanthomonas sp. PXM02]|uniref:rubredoxin n=1 Tax=Pseudoxanthomonas sp. PXM02 TaxID=2769294 RepID=UPI00177C312D|nr:rubredoxin [Pseudoxanthomonas sp. PXM02]MBD9478753.1 rubredoxin [Pseudoxanthomonas sp. PXM02]